jgi:integrase/recombinase XerD
MMEVISVVELHRNRFEEEGVTYLMLDRHERVIEYPTFYLHSLLQKPKFSAQSVYQFAKVLKYFCDELERKFPYMSVDDSLRSIEGNDIDRYLKKLALKGLEYSTIRNRDVIIKIFMEWLTTDEAGRARANSGYYDSRLKSPTPSVRLPKYVTASEVIEFLSHLHDESQRCLFHFMFDTGLRKAEVPRMKLSDLPDLSIHPVDRDYFKLRVPGVKGRGGQVKWRTTIITRTIVERINRLHKNNKQYMKASLRLREQMPMFLNVHGDPITDGAIADLVKKVNTRSGMNFSAHRFRHGFAMSVLASDLHDSLTNNLVVIREALGHNDISTTQIYTTIAPQVVEKMRNDNEAFNMNNRYEEAQWIYKETFKPQKKHNEKRGRGRRNEAKG